MVKIYNLVKRNCFMYTLCPWKLSLCTNWPGKTCLDSCISNSERNRTVRRQEEGKNSVYLFVFCINLGEINALLTISCCQMKHFGYVIVYRINWEINDNVPQNDDHVDPNPEFRSVSLWIARIEWNEMYWRNDWWIKMIRIVTLCF